MLSASPAALDLVVSYSRTAYRGTDSQFAALKSVAQLALMTCLLAEGIRRNAEERQEKWCDDSSVKKKAAAKVFRRVGAFRHVSCLIGDM